MMNQLEMMLRTKLEKELNKKMQTAEKRVKQKVKEQNDKMKKYMEHLESIILKNQLEQKQ